MGLRAGAIVFRDVRVSERHPDLESAIAAQVASIRGEFGSVAEIRALPEVSRYREILRSVGVRPKKQPPSVESLAQLAFKRGLLPSVNTLVDAYNLMSVKHRVSMGAHDLEKIAMPVELRIFRGDERFRPLGNSEATPTTAGEFGYIDSEGRVLCRLDILQADFSKVTPATRNVLMIIEATIAHDPATVREVFAETVKLVRRCCGGEAEVVSMPS